MPSRSGDSSRPSQTIQTTAESHLNATFATDFITALWLGFTGACIGSFLNVVAYRMPLGMSVVWKPSHCPKCDHPIRAYDNVPVLGWLWLRGKCRDCGEPISPRYAIVEFVMGLTFFVLAYVELFSGGANLPGGPITEFTGAVANVWYPQWELIGVYVYHCTLLCLLMCVVLMDQDSQQAPTKLVFFGLLIGFLAPFVWPHQNPSLSWPRSFENTFFSQFGGLLTGFAMGSIWWMRQFISDQRQWDVHRKNVGSMLILAGPFLGWQGMFTLCVVGLVFGSSWRFLQKWLKMSSRPIGHINYWFATMLLIVLWRQWLAVLS